ncbi:MAG: DUF4259 domain-containing protein [Candidatus Sumerlaeia bacterium]|nr:DUF4259 domain-containing protein [Candidatus Sumerlaeia bacterium]
MAALRGCPAANLPDEVCAFVARVDAPPSCELVSSALKALKRIRTQSELQELWDETESRGEWHQAVEELESRLA